MTLNQIFKIIEDFANSHSQINTVIYGASSEIDNTDVDGVLLWYDVSRGNTEGTQIEYTFELAFLDILNPDLGNLKDVMSDTLQVAMDIAAMIYNYDGDVEFDLPKSASIQPSEHRFLSDYAGHTVTFTINSPYEWNECQVPERVVSAPVAQPVFTIYDNDLVSVGTVTGDDLQVIARDRGNNIIDATYTLAAGVLTLSNINVIHMVAFTNVTTTLVNAAFANKPITEFIVLIAGTDWVTTGNASKVLASTTITLDTSAGGAIANVIYS